MFVVEYRTISRYGVSYPSNFLNICASLAQTREQAKAIALKRLGKNVEILHVHYLVTA